MTRVFLAALVGLAIGPFLPGLPEARAVDHGQMGESWAVIEPDLMEVIKAKLEEARRTGRLDQMNQQFANRVKERVMRPVPVGGIRPAQEDRVWEFDPAVTIERDIHDHKGNLIAMAGQRVNPLDTVALTQRLVFVNGDSDAELSWAMAQGDDQQAKIIFVNGSPFEQMKVHQRRFYFDQSGTLSEHFGIEHTPALVEQDGKILVIREKAISRRAS
ncbi:type-F conjugative transfer system protein TraW [Croceicoccus hydrothermalis]|uniref:type-F conjugative transfer system protein TraW n=1 Tax=Croceicoccus hydrothermalis TaxID=2867964 RepID=UPI001EFA3232